MFTKTGMKAYCRTTGWVVLEIIKNISSDASVDIWSTGCLLDALLTDVKPFNSDDDYELYEQVISGKVDLTASHHL
jgi:serine/threonine protein kinase